MGKTIQITTGRLSKNFGKKCTFKNVLKENVPLIAIVSFSFAKEILSITCHKDKIFSSQSKENTIYDVSKEDQLLEGFKILVENFQKGDSIVALIPSNLLFGRNGSFINKIPPFTPMKVNLKIK